MLTVCAHFFVSWLRTLICNYVSMRHGDTTRKQLHFRWGAGSQPVKKRENFLHTSYMIPLKNIVSTRTIPPTTPPPKTQTLNPSFQPTQLSTSVIKALLTVFILNFYMTYGERIQLSKDRLPNSNDWKKICAWFHACALRVHSGTYVTVQYFAEVNRQDETLDYITVIRWTADMLYR